MFYYTRDEKQKNWIFFMDAVLMDLGKYVVYENPIFHHGHDEKLCTMAIISYINAKRIRNSICSPNPFIMVDE